MHALLLIGVVAAAGCKDLGLQGNIPQAEAEHRPLLPLEAAVMARTAVEPGRLIVDGRLWVPTGRARPIAADALRPIGAAEGSAVHARSWDEPPYDALFVAVAMAGGERATAGTVWQEYAPVIGRSRGGPPPGAGAASDTGPARH